MTATAAPRRPASATPLGPYIRQVGNAPRLSADDERDLAARVADGDAEARDRLVRGNLLLVVALAEQFLGRGVEREDLVAEGNLGLIRAAETFDPAHGVRFGTYAAYWVKQSMRSAVLRGGSAVRLPAYMYTLLTKWRRAERALAEALGRPAAEAEVARALGLSPKRRRMAASALRVQAAARAAEAGDGPLAAAHLADAAGPGGETLEDAEQRAWLRGRLGELDARSALVLRLRFGLDGPGPLTLREVGAHLGLTHERARQIERDALRALAAAAN